MLYEKAEILIKRIIEDVGPDHPGWEIIEESDDDYAIAIGEHRVCLEEMKGHRCFVIRDNMRGFLHHFEPADFMLDWRLAGTEINDFHRSLHARMINIDGVIAEISADLSEMIDGDREERVRRVKAPNHESASINMCAVSPNDQVSPGVYSETEVLELIKRLVSEESINKRVWYPLCAGYSGVSTQVGLLFFAIRVRTFFMEVSLVQTGSTPFMATYSDGELKKLGWMEADNQLKSAHLAISAKICGIESALRDAWHALDSSVK